MHLKRQFFVTKFVQQTLNKTAVMTVKGLYPALNVISLSCLHTDESPAINEFPLLTAAGLYQNKVLST